MTPMLRRASFLGLLVVTAPALGDSNAQRADELFAEGRKLVLEGKYAEACPKFDEAYRLRPGVGTLLNLADCHERHGKTASALRVFEEALALAEQSKDDRSALAQARISALQPRVPKLTVVVPATTGVQVTLDGAALPGEQWGSPIALDPGSYTIAATAPNQPPFSQEVELFRGAVTVNVSFETRRATAAPALAPRPEPSADQRRPLSTQRMVALGVAGVGVVGLGVGAGFGLASLSAKRDADDRCQLGPKADQCDQPGVEAGDRAIARGNVATIAFIAGGAAVAAGAVLWFTDRPSQEQGAVVGLVPFGVRGRF